MRSTKWDSNGNAYMVLYDERNIVIVLMSALCVCAVKNTEQFIIIVYKVYGIRNNRTCMQQTSIYIYTLHFVDLDSKIL